MAFPTLAALDAAIFPVLSTTDEQAAVHITRDGVETPCTAICADVLVETYSDAGVVVSSNRREITIQRSEVSAPMPDDLVTVGGVTWRLTERVARDDGASKWAAAFVREAGA